MIEFVAGDTEILHKIGGEEVLVGVADLVYDVSQLIFELEAYQIATQMMLKNLLRIDVALLIIFVFLDCRRLRPVELSNE